MPEIDPSTVAPPPPRPDPYGAWKIPSYRMYAGSWFLITIARTVETVAVGVYLYAQTGDVLALGWQGLAQALPAMLLAIAGGHLADRFDRRMVLVFMLCLTGLDAVGLAAAAYLQAPVSWIYLLLVVNSIGQALGAPSRTALLSWIVPAERFSNAVTWNSTVFQIATMVGPVAGGLIISTDERLGVPLALAMVVACRTLGLLGTLSLKTTRGEQRGTSISLESLMAGIRFVWNYKPILATITLDLFAVLLGGATFVLPAFADRVLHVPKESVGAVVGSLRSAEAAGAIVMAIILAHLPPIRRAGWTMLWAVAGFGAATVCLGFSQALWASLLAMFAIGALDNISVVVRHTMIQLLTPDAMRGRVTAVNNVFIVASNELGGMESGCTAWLFGLVPSIVGGGFASILVVVACAWLWPQILRIGSLADLRPIDESIARQEADEQIAGR